MFELVTRRARRQDSLAMEPYDCWRHPEGGIALEFRRTDVGFHLRFPDRADFEIDIARRTATVYPALEEDGAAAEDLFANQVGPLLDAWEGALILHGSAVEYDGAVLGFLGASGRGKSTLAAAFARRGYAYLTDDGLALEIEASGYRALPSHSSVRLLPDSQAVLLGHRLPVEDDDERKRRITAPDLLPHSPDAAPLRALFLIGPSAEDRPSISRLSASASLDALIAHSFMLDTTDKPRMRTHFGSVAALASNVPCFTLDYCRDFAQLDEVINAVVECAATL